MHDALLVTCHPRTDSLTAAVAEAFAGTASGVQFERADLYAEGFDPRLGPEDEPDWEDQAKTYSEAVRAEMRRIERNAATVMVFPAWWWSVPAMLKGWIDRVWNYGWAYGDKNYPHRHVWMVAVCGNGADAYAKRGYDEAMRVQLEVGVLDYCGVAAPRLEMLYGSIEGDEFVTAILKDAARLGAEFSETLTR